MKTTSGDWRAGAQDDPGAAALFFLIRCQVSAIGFQNDLLTADGWVVDDSFVVVAGDDRPPFAPCCTVLH